MISEKNDTWEIQFTIATNFVSCKNKDEECVQKVAIKKLRLMSKQLRLLKNFLNQNKVPMRGIDFIFDCIYSRYHKCHKINFKRGGSFS